MKSRHWDNITTPVRTNIKLPKGTALFTKKQWLERGYTPISDYAGQKLWTNQHCQKSVEYYFLDEVRALTEEEKKAIKEAKKEHAKELKLKSEEKTRETMETLKAECKELSKINDKLFAKLHTTERAYISIIKKAVETIISDRTYTKDKIVVLDTETTGLKDTDELLQLSMVDIEGNTLYNSYIQPLFHADWEEAENINHITMEMVQNAPTIFEEAKKIANILDGAAAIIGYSVDFDINVLERFGISINEHIQVIDILPVFAEIYGEWNEKYQGYKWPSLTTCANYYGYEWKMDTHNSLADCLATLYCYKQMIKGKEITNYEQIKRN